MSPSDPSMMPRRFDVDWRGWIALAWMVGSGLLYAVMILREKAPGLLARVSIGG